MELDEEHVGKATQGRVYQKVHSSAWGEASAKGRMVTEYTIKKRTLKLSKE